MARRKHRIVATDHMVPADPFTRASLFGCTEPLTTANSSTNGHARRPGDDYWARALGKAPVPPVTPLPAAVRRPSDNTAERSSEAGGPAGPTAASYWDRARGVAPRRPSPPERPTAPPPAAAVLVASETLQHAQVTTEDTTVLSAAWASRPASVLTVSLATGEPVGPVRGAHARKEDPLAAEVRGAHVKADDPIAGAGWEAQLNEDDALADPVRGAHVKADDPLADTLRPSHAPKTTDPVKPSEAEVAEAAAEAVRAKTRRRRWGVVPAAGAAAALAVGLGGGGAYAYLSSHGNGTGHATAGSPSNVILGQATIGTVTTYLIPGGTGDLFVKVNNPNNQPVTITGISQTGGVTVSGGVGSCTSDPSWPGTFGTSGVSVPTNNTLNISVPGLSGSSYQVDIPNAASMTTASATGCQSATFQIPVTITVRMG
jgi:hypothetical protein